ncbi:sensor histidine kinase [Rhizobium tubonense]|uniref:histidine kinase n=1 Tax=Rhizobium tubonense TaxID=484088 RepID=A0A2W4CTV0_9HYPH|nr:HAMP domain-containing sensor histidine kinase [Rhizobium tubonense]PZM13775.1 two-component sensor histidine kinase [Rhizobium tubonense]
MRWGLNLGSIRDQIFMLTALPIVILSVVASAFWLSINNSESRAEWANHVVGGVEMVADQVRFAGSAQAEDTVLQASARAGLSASIVSASDTDGINAIPHAPNAAARLLLGKGRPETDRSLQGAVVDGQLTDLLVVRLDPSRALAFRVPVAPSFPWLTKASVRGLTIIAVIMLAALLIAFYASRRITSSLVRFAAEAERISLDDNSNEQFNAVGALEIRSLAESLNTMRSRILRMFGDRTQMLRAISHDLRTPLTRLQMRAERSQEPELRQSMLADISTLTEMTDECLTFLNKVPVEETPRKVDLTSLLQTVVADFSDVGVAVTFKGPRRLAYTCRPQSLIRAVSNVIDNASRFAALVEIELIEMPDGGADITISDDGPGLSEALKKRVLEPFFKVDKARKVGKGGGFGLGLPIAKGIIQHHGGSLRLSDRKPNGLVVEFHLPSLTNIPDGKIL